MKKILSMSAITAITAILLASNAQAKECCSFAKETNLSSVSSYTNEVSVTKSASETDRTIQELLKDFETIYKDYCGNNTVTPTPPTVPDDNNQESGNGGNTPIPDQNGSVSNPGGSSDSAYSSYINEIIALVNEERATRGLNKLSASNQALNKAATVRAQEQKTLFSHTRPDGSKWSTVLGQNNVSYRTAGENVAYGQSTPAEVMNAWMNSSGHRANILGENFSEIGVGVYYKDGTYYWSQLFIG